MPVAGCVPDPPVAVERHNRHGCVREHRLRNERDEARAGTQLKHFAVCHGRGIDTHSSAARLSTHPRWGGDHGREVLRCICSHRVTHTATSEVAMTVDSRQDETAVGGLPK